MERVKKKKKKPLQIYTIMAFRNTCMQKAQNKKKQTKIKKKKITKLFPLHLILNLSSDIIMIIIQQSDFMSHLKTN